MFDAERALEEIQRQFSHYPTLRRPTQGFVPRIEAVEGEDHYLVRAELPGVDAADLEIVVEEGVLTIKGRRSDEQAEAVVDVEVEVADEAAEANAEAPTGATDEDAANDAASDVNAFERRIRFNGEVDEAAVKARYRNGLLTVVIPKPRPPEPVIRNIPVQVA